MGGTWAVVIPGDPPATNRSYRVGWVRGRPVISKRPAVESWQVRTAALVAAARPANWQPGERVRLLIEWYPSRRRDGDAGLKVLLDAIANGLGCDDAVFLPCVVCNELDRDRPRTVVTITNEEDRHRHLK